MKAALFNLFLIMIISGCTIEDKILNTSEKLEFSLIVDVNDLISKNQGTEADNNTSVGCPNPNDFKNEVENNLYKADLYIKLAPSVANGGSLKKIPDLKLFIENRNGKECIATSSFSLRKPEFGNHSLEHLIIKNNAGEEVYSSVRFDSFYSTHVNYTTPFDLVFPSGTLVGDNSMNIRMQIDVLCAVNR